MQRAIWSATTAQRKAFGSLDAATAFAATYDIPALLRAGHRALNASQALLNDTLPPILLTTAVRAAQRVTISDGLRAAESSPIRTVMTFDNTNPLAIAWAKQHGSTLVREITDAQRAAIRDIIGDALTIGLAPKDAARLIRDTVGLTSRQAASVTNFTEKLYRAKPGDRIPAFGTSITAPAKGFTAKRIAQETEKYAQRVHARRALTIARTETMFAANKGQQLVWQANINAGRLTGKEQQEWIVTPDDRLCPQCAPLDGMQVPLNAAFTANIYAPPLHPNCRCTIALVPIAVTKPAPPPPPPPVVTTDWPAPIGPAPKPKEPAPARTPRAPRVPRPKKVLPQFKRVKFSASRLAGFRTSKGLPLDPAIADRFNYLLENGKAMVDELRATYPQLEKFQVKTLVFHDKLAITWKQRDGNKMETHRANGTWISSQSRIDIAMRFGKVPERLVWAEGKRVWTVGDSALATLRHEIGHGVHLQHISSADRMAWREIWDQSPMSRKRGISDYATTNEKELFAEAFALYTSPQRNGRLIDRSPLDPDKPGPIHRYFDDLLSRKKV